LYALLWNKITKFQLAEGFPHKDITSRSDQAFFYFLLFRKRVADKGAGRVAEVAWLGSGGDLIGYYFLSFGLACTGAPCVHHFISRTFFSWQLRKDDVREPTPHTWSSFHGYLFNLIPVHCYIQCAALLL